jgi:phosphoribosyl-ATP pyrophosphohydrolase
MNDILIKLEKVINERINEGNDQKREQSYTVKLLNEGVTKCAEKFGEEAVELIVACLGKKTDAIVHEAADTLYHLNVLIRSKNISIKEVLEELAKREGVSGLEEKENRGSKK